MGIWSGWPFVRNLFAALALLAVVAASGCGGGAGAGVPLVSTTLTGAYAGQPFTPAFGVATVYQGSNLFALGDGPLNCASAQQSDPPSGTNAVFRVPALAVGSYSSVFVDIIQNKGNFMGAGSNDATVTITAVGASSVAGSIAYSYTDSMNQTYGLSGDFEVTRCPM